VTLNSSGQAASSRISTLAAGTHSITALYTPNAPFLSSSGKLSQMFKKK